MKNNTVYGKKPTPCYSALFVAHSLTRTFIESTEFYTLCVKIKYLERIIYKANAHEKIFCWNTYIWQRRKSPGLSLHRLPPAVIQRSQSHFYPGNCWLFCSSVKIPYAKIKLYIYSVHAMRSFWSWGADHPASLLPNTARPHRKKGRVRQILSPPSIRLWTRK